MSSRRARLPGDLDDTAGAGLVDHLVEALAEGAFQISEKRLENPLAIHQCTHGDLLALLGELAEQPLLLQSQGRVQRRFQEGHALFEGRLHVDECPLLLGERLANR